MHALCVGAPGSIPQDGGRSRPWAPLGVIKKQKKKRNYVKEFVTEKQEYKEVTASNIARADITWINTLNYNNILDIHILNLT